MSDLFAHDISGQLKKMCMFYVLTVVDKTLRTVYWPQHAGVSNEEDKIEQWVQDLGYS